MFCVWYHIYTYIYMSPCHVFPVGEYRLSREDGAHYQGFPHPRQPLGSVL